MDADGASPPCSPLSVLSKSPSLPPASPRPSLLPGGGVVGSSSFAASKRYPSPSSMSSTSQSGSASPLKLSSDDVEPEESGGQARRGLVRTASDQNGGESEYFRPPPSKRRKMEKKPRTTEYLDLGKCAAESRSADDDLNLERLMDALRKKKKVVVVAGAGISVSAGIPDFRSSAGLFRTLRDTHGLKASGKHLFDASVYKHDSSTTSFHDMVRELADLTKIAKPTPFHHMLASMAEEGRLMRLYSQNVDGIDTSMQPLETAVPLNIKGPWPRTIQLHGGLEKMVCTKCRSLEPFEGALFQGPEPPPCRTCTEVDNVRTSHAGKRSHGIGRMRPRMVLYNEYNPDEEAIGMVSTADLRSRPDAVIVVGTSLKIPGVRRLVKEMCQVTRGRRDGFTAWINVDPEPQGVDFKDCWDLVVKAKCDDVASLVSLPRWDDKEEVEMAPLSEDEQAMFRGARVTIPIQELDPHMEPEKDAKAVATDAGIPTPSSTPTMGRTTLASITKARKPGKTKQSKLSLPGSDDEKHLDASMPIKKPRKVGRPRKADKESKAKGVRKTGARDSLKDITSKFRVTKHVAPSESMVKPSKTPTETRWVHDARSSSSSSSSSSSHFTARPGPLAVASANKSGEQQQHHRQPLGGGDAPDRKLERPFAPLGGLAPAADIQPDRRSFLSLRPQRQESPQRPFAYVTTAAAAAAAPPPFRPMDAFVARSASAGSAAPPTTPTSRAHDFSLILNHAPISDMRQASGVGNSSSSSRSHPPPPPPLPAVFSSFSTTPAAFSTPGSAVSLLSYTPTPPAAYTPAALPLRRVDIAVDALGIFATPDRHFGSVGRYALYGAHHGGGGGGQGSGASTPGEEGYPFGRVVLGTPRKSLTPTQQPFQLQPRQDAAGQSHHHSHHQHQPPQSPPPNTPYFRTVLGQQP